MPDMILRQTNTENIASHFQRGSVKKFSKGEIIFQGDSEPQGIYLIQSGYVKAYSISQLGQQNLLLIHGNNDIMPLPWALDGPQETGIFYEAMSDVRVLHTSKESLRSAMELHPWLTEQLLTQLVVTFTVYAQRVRNLVFRSPRERVIACLLDLATRFGKAKNNVTIIDVPLTHQDIGNSVNMTRETASRVLGQLFDEKLVSQVDRLFVIHDEVTLQTELN